MFTRVLVANRGEIAVRIIRALHELGIEAVAVYSTADADALHVRLADRAVCIGPPPPGESYLHIPSVVAAAETTGCQAVHPGYGFLAERPEFVRACAENDLVFIGPDADVMARMGDKARRRSRCAKRASRCSGHRGRRQQARELAPDLPVLLEASAGGGGRGIFVASADELDSACDRVGRGGRGLRRRVPLRREGARNGTSRRDPGSRRRTRRRPHPW